MRTQLVWPGGVLAVGAGLFKRCGRCFPFPPLPLRAADAASRSAPGMQVIQAELDRVSCAVWRNWSRKLHSLLRISGYESICWRNFSAYFSFFFFCKGNRRGDRKGVLKVKENAVTLLHRDGKHPAALGQFCHWIGFCICTEMALDSLSYLKERCWCSLSNLKERDWC